MTDLEVFSERQTKQVTSAKLPINVSYIHTRCLLYAERHAADSGLSLLLNLSLGLGSTVPVAQEESTVLHLLLELLVVLALVDVSVTIVLSLLEYVLLDVLKQLLYILSDAVDRAPLALIMRK